MAQRRDLLGEVVGVAGDVAAVYALPGIDAFLDRICSTMRAVAGAQACSIAVVDEDEFELHYRAAAGQGADAVRGMRLPLDAGLAGFVASSGHAISVEDVRADPRHASDVAEQVGYVPRSMVVVPITDAAGDVRGVVSILDRTVDAVGDVSLLDLAADFADLAALGIVLGGHAEALGAALLGALAEAAPLADAGARDSLAAALRARAEREDEEPSPTAEVAARFAELRALGPGVAAAAANILDELIVDRESGQGPAAMTLIPAWADAFVEGRLASAPTPALTGPITAEWAYGDRSGRGVKVAIVDSGVDADHPWVRGVNGGVVIEADDDAPDGTRVDVIEHGDLYGHGTACAAIIRSLAPEVEIHSVRVLGSQLTGRAFVFARGLEWCIDNGMDVVNLSLSTSNDDWYAAFQDLCDQAAFAGMVLVAAPANVRRSSYPAEFSSVLSVAATIGQDREAFVRNPKPPAEWGAPGVDIEVAWAGGGSITSTGNSFAAPVIAGHAARILGAHPGLTPWQVRTILAALATNAVPAGGAYTPPR